MAKRITTNVEIGGPLVDIPNITAAVHEVLREGIGELVDAGRDIAKDFAPSSSGRFRAGIKSIKPRDKLLGVARQTDTYGRGTARPISTWLERGTRRGVKLRKGKGIFTTAYRRIDAIDKDTYFIGKLAERFGND